VLRVYELNVNKLSRGQTNIYKKRVEFRLILFLIHGEQKINEVMTHDIKEPNLLQLRNFNHSKFLTKAITLDF
jgi:hypothetical protein